MNKSLVVSRLLAVLGLMVFHTTGCGPEQKSDPNRMVVSGTVTFEGKPLPAGNISFTSTEAPRSTSISIRGAGKYMTDRAPVGPNIVTIETESLLSGSPHLYTKIPAKYADPSQSGLEVDIKPGVNENVNFELTK